MLSALEILQKGREYLSNIDNWCPYGSHDGDKTCAYYTLAHVNKEENRESTHACFFLSDAARLLFGALVVDVNDGHGSFIGVPKEERHKAVLQVYDKAIQLAEDKPK